MVSEIEKSNRSLTIVESKQDYLDRLQLALQQSHNCGAVHIKSVRMHEVFPGQGSWVGDVEVFELNGHPEAKRAYSWCHSEGRGDQIERFVAVLEIPPVVSPATAVRASLLAERKREK